MTDLDLDIELLRRWAASNPIVDRVWLFGSRVKGTNRPDSDLDVAIEHGAAPGDGDVFTTSLMAPKEWQAELQPHARLKLDMWSYRPGDTDRIEGALKEASRLIYERHKRI